MGAVELMSARKPWMEEGYGDVEATTRVDDLVEVVFANGDVVRLDAAALGLTGEFSVGVAEGGAAIQVTAPEGEREIDWMVIRSAADSEFAQELRERDAEEARRIGRRLRALRENQGMSQKAVAGVVGMSAPQLAKLEQGETDMRISTLRSLLRALGASFADIAGPDAPEVSVKELTKRAQRAGVPVEVMKRIAAVAGPRQLTEVLARAFGWDSGSMLTGALSPPVPTAPATLKRRSATGDESQALVALGEALARRSALAYAGTPGAVPDKPKALRQAVAGGATEITLEALLAWCWRAGIVVVPMDAAGGFSAGAWIFGDQPVVVLKEAPDYKAYWLFALAHELGHLAHGHVTRGGLVDLGSSWEGQRDGQEDEANAYALNLLVPDHVAMLDEIRHRSQGPQANVKFKFKAIDAAEERGYNVPLVVLIAAFGLPDVARPSDRWGSANNEARQEGSARAVAVREFERHVDLDRLDRLDSLLLRAVALGQ
jgi:transcriptional regulator with XRE-family HTH domain/Zn-dependent peptidase ImmA (M78 family)